MIGVLFGRTKWFNTHKTVEGTTAAILSTYFACLVWNYLTTSEFGISISLSLTIFLCFILEALTVQIDNLFLPLFGCMLMNLFSEFENLNALNVNNIKFKKEI